MTFTNLRYGSQFVYDEKISKLRGGTWYSAILVYEQEFKGWKGAEATFSDKVERVQTVYVEKIEEVIDGKVFDSFHARLGDSKVTEIEAKQP